MAGNNEATVFGTAESVPIRLIVVEDDAVTRAMIVGYFTSEGFCVAEAATCYDCKTLLKKFEPDLIFIDIHLPDGSGMDLAREIRGKSPVGIIFVTQRDSDSDKVTGLELGGDDYVTKPVNLRELLARSRALLRRRTLERAPRGRAAVLTFGPWILDLTRRELAVQGGAPIQLTRAEFDLLAVLAEANGLPLDREYLIEVVSKRSLASDLRTVDAIVARLRRKLGPVAGGGPVIVTVAGIGYKLGIAAAAS